MTDKKIGSWVHSKETPYQGEIIEILDNGDLSFKGAWSEMLTNKKYEKALKQYYDIKEKVGECKFCGMNLAAGVEIDKEGNFIDMWHTQFLSKLSCEFSPKSK